MRSVRQAWGSLIVTALGLLSPFQGFCTSGIVVYASDTSAFGVPPPSSTAILDGTDTLSFGTNYWVTFSNITAGAHTVEVTCAASGYLPRESPDFPDAINNPTSEYGNPRMVTALDNQSVSVTFRFDPVVFLSAVVRDAWTMERIGNASVSFTFNGSTESVSVCKYPAESSYATNWTSDSTGDIHPAPVLYLHDYNIEVTRDGYQTFTQSNVVVSASPGDEINLEELFLIPVDSNTNLIADAWEALYFGAGSTVVADGDADGDGVCNFDEYVAGTDPTNAWSFLSMTLTPGENELVLNWNTELWRTYRICGNTHLATGDWVQVAGPWESTNGQSEMSWVETNLDLSWNSNYRVEVMPSTWQGTNQMLVHTNDWPSGGGESGTNGPPIP